LDYRDAFIMMGSIVMASSFTSFFIKIPCHAGLISGEDNHAVINARERHIQRLQYEASQSEGDRTEQHEEAAILDSAAADQVETGKATGQAEESDNIVSVDEQVPATDEQHDA
jgi:hypothetical protein